LIALIVDIILDARIIGGIRVQSGQFPWTGEVYSLSRYCTTTLIRNDRALTAGNCVDGATTATTWFGDVYRGGAGEIGRLVSSIQFHPLYDFNSRINDLAILRLTPPYVLSDTIQPIRLPTNNNDDFAWQSGTATGFGLTENGQNDYVRWGMFGIFERATCRTLLADEETAADIDKLICGGTSIFSKCFGDTGGPLAVRNDGGDWQLVGITARVRWNDCRPIINEPSIFIRVSEYLPWINEFLAED
jgi:secreted trypsin-like serine protease